MAGCIKAGHQPSIAINTAKLKEKIQTHDAMCNVQWTDGLFIVTATCDAILK